MPGENRAVVRVAVRIREFNSGHGVRQTRRGSGPLQLNPAFFKPVIERKAEARLRLELFAASAAGNEPVNRHAIYGEVMTEF